MKIIRKIICIFTVMSILCSAFCTVSISAEEKDFSVVGKGSMDGASRAQGISVYGNAAYITDSAAGLRVIDISDLSSPKDVTPDEDTYKGTTYGGGTSNCVNDGFLYMCFSEASPDKKANKGVRKYDISNPLKPEYICTYYVEFRAYAVAAQGDYVYVADLERGLKVYKNNDSEPIRSISEGKAQLQLRSLFIRDDLLYVSYSTGFMVYDISKPEKIHIYSVFSSDEMKNNGQITADENGVYLIGKGEDECGVVYMLDLKDDGGDPAYAQQAQMSVTSLDEIDLNPTCIRAENGYLYIANATKIAIIELKGMPKIKRFRTFNNSLSYFVLTNDHIIGINGASLTVMTRGALGEGVEIPDHQSVYNGIKEENLYRENVTFSDIKNHSKRSEIEKTANEGIVSGNSENMFRPDDNTTVAEFVSMLLKTVGINYVDYIDAYYDTTADDWFSGDIQIASDVGLLDGFTDNPRDYITRGKAALLLERALAYKNGKEIKFRNNTEINDINEADEQSRDAIRLCVDKGLIKFAGGKNFNPEEKITRAEAAESFSKTLTFMKNQKIDRSKLMQPPIITRVSDAVAPGDAFNIYGDGFDPNNTSVKIEKVISDKKTAEPGSSAAELEAVFEDAGGNYISAVMPKEFESGAYMVWVRNEYGWSKPYYINKARTQWISTGQTAAGCDVYVTGRNFDCSEFGGKTATKVYVKGDNGTFDAKCSKITPFYVLFTLDVSVPDGSYKVFVSNDGILYEEQSSEQVLEVKRKTYDPYGLGVSWVDQFNWNNIVNVKDFGATGNGTDDDGAAINAAIDSIWMDGGVVYFPEGTYITEQVLVPGHVILAGDGMDKTKILYKPDKSKTQAEIKSKNFISSDYNRCGEDGRQGLVNLTLDYSRDENGNSYHPSLLPGQLVWLGGTWNTRDVPKRTASYIFMKGVRFGSHSMDYYNESEEHMAEYAQMQTRTYVLADKYVLCEDNIFEMDGGAYTGYYNGYIQCRNNKSNVLAGSFYNHAMYCVYDNNQIKNLEWQYGKTVRVSRQGIYYKTHTLVTNNKVTNSASWTHDGEVFATEAYQSGNSIIGNVVSAGTSSIKVEGYKNDAGYELRAGGNANTNGAYGYWDIKQRAYGVGNVWRIIIVDGKGVGQCRAIVASDVKTHTIKVDKPWTVMPDSTSKFTVYMPEDENTVYKNEANNTGWGFLSYGNTTDTVYADNIGINTTGLQFWSILITQYGKNTNDSWNCRAWHQYFCRAARNEFRGTSWKSKLVAIELTVSMSNNYAPHGYYNYGQEIKGNTVQGEKLTGRQILDHWEKLRGNGAGSVGEGFYSGISIPCTPDGAGRHLRYYEEKGIQGLIIQNNHLVDLDRGITLGGLGYYREEYRDECTNVDQCNTNGVVIKGNTFENVTTPYCRFGDTGTVFLDNNGKVVEKS